MIDIFSPIDIGYSEELQWKREKRDDFFIEEEHREESEIKEPLGEE